MGQELGQLVIVLLGEEAVQGDELVFGNPSTRLLQNRFRDAGLLAKNRGIVAGGFGGMEKRIHES
jgi:hypothetical protein